MLSTRNASRDAISALVVVEPAIAATGDDAGFLRLWDLRSNRVSAEATPHTDFVAAVLYHEKSHSIVCLSGDGTLSVFDVVAGKVAHRSDTDADDELLSGAVVRNESKVLVGTQSGVMNIFSWGFFSDCSARFPGHPESIDSMVTVSQHHVVTGAGDGRVRLV